MSSERSPDAALRSVSVASWALREETHLHVLGPPWGNHIKTGVWRTCPWDMSGMWPACHVTPAIITLRCNCLLVLGLARNSCQEFLRPGYIRPEGKVTETRSHAYLFRQVPKSNQGLGKRQRPSLTIFSSLSDKKCVNILKIGWINLVGTQKEKSI